MNTAKLEKTLKNTLHVLFEIIPQRTNLYLPLISSAVIWAVRRTAEWKEKIFSWKVWADPDYIKGKPDEFILDFFQNNPELRRIYEKEIVFKEMSLLRNEFACLYPILGLQDPFLSALFLRELETGNFKKITKEFKGRIKDALKAIEGVKDKDRLIECLGFIAGEAASIGLDLLTQAKVLNVLDEAIKKHLDKDDG